MADAALMLEVMAGPSAYDQFSLPEYTGSFIEDLKGDIKGLRIAYSSDLGGGFPVDNEVMEITRKAALGFADMGCVVDEVQPGWLNTENDFLITIVLDTYEVSRADSERFKNLAVPSTLHLIELAEKFTKHDLINIQFDRCRLTEQVARLFEKYDLLLTPTTAAVAFETTDGGPLWPRKINNKKVGPASWICFNYPFNFTGQPAASVPCGFNSQGLPVGLQIVGRRLEESLVLGPAAAFERDHPWAGKSPLYNLLGSQAVEIYRDPTRPIIERVDDLALTNERR